MPAFSDVSFTVKPGEIVGLTGLLGSGRMELALTLAGKSKPSSGSIRLAGEKISLRNVRDAQRHGIGYIPEDRLSEGLFLEQEIFDIMLIANLRRRLSFGLLDRKTLRGVGRSTRIGQHQSPGTWDKAENRVINLIYEHNHSRRAKGKA